MLQGRSAKYISRRDSEQFISYGLDFRKSNIVELIMYYRALLYQVLKTYRSQYYSYCDLASDPVFMTDDHDLE